MYDIKLLIDNLVKSRDSKFNLRIDYKKIVYDFILICYLFYKFFELMFNIVFFFIRMIVYYNIFLYVRTL